MSFLFGSRKTPEQMLRENKRLLDKSIREIDRERTNMERQVSCCLKVNSKMDVLAAFCGPIKTSFSHEFFKCFTVLVMSQQNGPQKAARTVFWKKSILLFFCYFRKKSGFVFGVRRKKQFDLKYLFVQNSPFCSALLFSGDQVKK